MKNFVLVLVVLLIASCGTRKVSSYKGDTTLIKKDSLIINLDARTSFEFQNVRYYSNDTIDWLIVLNQNINGLNIYDINTSNLVSQFSLPSVGPGSLPEVNGMTVLSPDSIFLYTKMSLMQMQVVDYTGKAIKNLRFNNAQVDTDLHQLPIINHQSNSFSPTVKLRNKLYFTRWPIFDYARPENISDEYSLELTLDLKTQKIEALPIHFPKWMQGKGWNMMYLLNGKVINDQKDLVYNFSGEDSIRVLTSEGQSESYYAGYSKAVQNKESIRSMAQKSKNVEEAMTTNLYWGLIFDPFRNLYYRIVDRPVSFRPEHTTLLSTYEKPMSIIILNSDFKKIGETDLPEDTYLFYGLFAGKKGLYIPRLHPNYEYFSEDQITYSIYEPTQLSK